MAIKNQTQVDPSRVAEQQSLGSHERQETQAQRVHPATALQRVMDGSTSAPRRADVRALQRAVGNRKVGRILAGKGAAGAGSPFPVQAKLMVTPAGDRYEREADRVADMIVNTSAPVQRQIEEEEVQRKPVIQRLTGDGGVEAGSDFQSQLNSVKGGGKPLPSDIQAAFGQQLGADLSRVRVHTGAASADLADQIHARAFTYGRDIHLGERQYNPATRAGRFLLAHEAIHTIQQTGGVPYGQGEKQGPGPSGNHDHGPRRGAGLNAQLAGKAGGGVGCRLAVSVGGLGYSRDNEFRSRSEGLRRDQVSGGKVRDQGGGIKGLADAGRGPVPGGARVPDQAQVKRGDADTGGDGEGRVRVAEQVCRGRENGSVMYVMPARFWDFSQVTLRLGGSEYTVSRTFWSRLHRYTIAGAGALGRGGSGAVYPLEGGDHVLKVGEPTVIAREASVLRAVGTNRRNRGGHIIRLVSGPVALTRGLSGLILERGGATAHVHLKGLWEALVGPHLPGDGGAQDEPRERAYVDAVTSITADIAAGLREIHAQGYAHRDLKPENVVIARYGNALEARLIDLGCATGVAENVSYGATPGYTSILNNNALADYQVLGTCLMQWLARAEHRVEGFKYPETAAENAGWAKLRMSGYSTHPTLRTDRRLSSLLNLARKLLWVSGKQDVNQLAVQVQTALEAMRLGGTATGGSGGVVFGGGDPPRPGLAWKEYGH